jgi:hypothetical protein
VGKRRPVLDREDALPGDLVRVLLDLERRRGADDRRPRIHRADRLEDCLDSFLGRGVDLVHDTRIGHAQIDLAGVVAELVAGSVRIDDDEVQIGMDEGDVVVAPVPDDDVGLLLSPLEDGAVVDPREDEIALGEMGLVLLALLDGGVGGFEILVPLEALEGLLREVAVRHRMAQDCDALACTAKQRGDMARRLALAGAGSHSADGDDRLRPAKLG